MPFVNLSGRAINLDHILEVRDIHRQGETWEESGFFLDSAIYVTEPTEADQVTIVLSNGESFLLRGQEATLIIRWVEQNQYTPDPSSAQPGDDAPANPAAY